MATPDSNDVTFVSMERRVTLGLATLLVANPVIIFLLTTTVWIAVVVTAIAVLAVQVVYSQPRLRLLTAYVFNAFVLVSIFAHAEAIILFAYPDYVIRNLYTIEDGYYFNRPFLNEQFIDKEYTATYKTNAQGLRMVLST